MKALKRLFGGLELTWPRVIAAALIAGAYTGLMAMLPITKDTSFRNIAISFEGWILLGVLIIMNSRSPLDSALKCFVFFLISQPLCYLVQVPFSSLGWGIAGYRLLQLHSHEKITKSPAVRRAFAFFHLNIKYPLAFLLI